MKLTITTPTLILTLLTSISHSAPAATPQTFDGTPAYYNFVGDGGRSQTTWIPVDRRSHDFGTPLSQPPNPHHHSITNVKMIENAATQITVHQVTSGSKAFCQLVGVNGGYVLLFGRQTKNMEPPQRMKNVWCFFF